MSYNILHVEGAVTYGGSVESLRTQLRFFKSDKFKHFVLFYHDVLDGVPLSGSYQELVCFHLKPQLSIGDQAFTERPPLKDRRVTGGIPFARITPNWMWKVNKILRRDWPIFLRLIYVMKTRKIDLLDLNNPPTLHAAAIVAANVLGLPCMSHLRTFPPRRTNLSRLISQLVTRYVAVSEATKSTWVRDGVSQEKVTTIYPGVDVERFSVGRYSEEKRREFDIPKDVPIVGIVGRLVSWKGHKYFVEAACKVVESYPQVKFMIVGGQDPSEPEFVEELRNKIIKEGMINNVIMTGFRTDVSDFIANMDVVVHASSSPEPFGLVIVEAMAAAKPVIATNIGGPVEIIQDGVTGLLVPPRDPSKLAEAILSLLQSRKAQKLGQNALEHVKENFTIQKGVRQLEDLYNILLT